MRVPRPSYANLTSTLALFIALGGTSYAVSQLPRNSVGNRQLKSNAVSSAKIRDGAVATRDLSSTARAAVRGQRGPAGPAGRDGAPGPTGPSETIQVRPKDPVPLLDGPRAPTTLASLTLEPGSWLIDGRSTIVHDGPPTFYDCFLRTSAGAALGIETAQVGNALPGALGIQIAIQSATEFTVATQVLLSCETSTATTGPAHGYYISLIATRVGRVENR